MSDCFGRPNCWGLSVLDSQEVVPVIITFMAVFVRVASHLLFLLLPVVSFIVAVREGLEVFQVNGCVGEVIAGSEGALGYLEAHSQEPGLQNFVAVDRRVQQWQLVARPDLGTAGQVHLVPETFFVPRRLCNQPLRDKAWLDEDRVGEPLVSTGKSSRVDLNRHVLDQNFAPALVGDQCVEQDAWVDVVDRLSVDYQVETDGPVVAAKLVVNAFIRLDINDTLRVVFVQNAVRV